MSIKVKETRVRDVSIFELVGRVSLGEGAVTFRDAVRNAVWEGRVKLALDYGEVSYTDSSGIGELLSAFTVVRNAEGELVLVDLDKRVKALLQITKFYPVFTVFEKVEQALDYFDTHRATTFRVVQRDQDPVMVLQASGALTADGEAAKLVDVIRQYSGRRVAILCPQVLDIDECGARSLVISKDILGGTERLALVGFEDGVRRKLLMALQDSEKLAVFPHLDAALIAFGVDVKKQYPWRKKYVL